MSPGDLLRLSLARIRARLLESVLVASGVAAAVAVIASTLSLYRFVDAGLGIGRELREISVHAADAAYPADEPVLRIGAGAAGASSLKPEDIAAVREACPSVVAGYFRGLVALTRGGEVTAVVAGDYFAAHGLGAAEGTLFTPAEEAQGARLAVLGAAKARSLFRSGSAVGSRLTIAGLEYTVVGVLAPTPLPDAGGPRVDDLAFVPLRSTVVFERLKTLPGLTFLADSPETVRRAAEEIRAFFDERFGPGAVIITARLDAIARERERIGGVLLVLLLFGAGALVVGSVDLLNVLLARAARRVRATGIEMALGASRGSVIAVSMAESLALAAVGCMAGIALSILFNALLGALFAEVGAPGESVSLTAAAALAAVLATLAANALLAAVPAIRASRLEAADAIRTE